MKNLVIDNLKLVRKEWQKNIIVQKTKDYNMFKFLHENRDVSKPHVRRLIASMEKKYIPVPIIVNEKMEIIDGQHRFHACKELNLPISYIIIKGLTIKDVSILNTNMKKWNLKEYLETECKKGSYDYQVFSSWMKDYKLGFDQVLCLLRNIRRRTDSEREDFKEGFFRINNYDTAEKNLKKLIAVSKFYSGWNRRNFVYCMLDLFDNSEYSHTQFLKKLEIQQRRMVDCLTVEEYVDLVEEIYNYSRKGRKVRFLF
jgi:hypothetical protein